MIKICHKIFLTSFIFLLSLQIANASDPNSEPLITIYPSPQIKQGSAAKIQISNFSEINNLSADFNGQKIFFFTAPDQSLIGIFGVDVALEAGSYPLTVNLEHKQKKSKNQKLTKTFNLEISEHDYGTRNITVPKNQVELSKENLARAAAERLATSKALATQSPEKIWNGQFLNPVNYNVVSAFGRRSKINGVLNPRPHSGVDLKAATGTIIKAPADGKVLLAADHFFAGQSIYIDHGQGLITMYFHLSKTYVKDDDLITKGQNLGEVGATGRVTGPHLHYGLYLNQARLDPFSFHRLLELSPLGGDLKTPITKAN